MDLNAYKVITKPEYMEGCISLASICAHVAFKFPGHIYLNPDLESYAIYAENLCEWHA
jgi:hypothetical protein